MMVWAAVMPCVAWADRDEPEVSPRLAAVLARTQEIAGEESPQAALKYLQGEYEPGRDAVADYARGNLYMEQGDYTNALAAYQASVESRPHFYRAVRELGRLYLLQGEADKTISLYQPLIREGRPTDETLYLLLGYALMMQGRLISAEQAYRSALLLAPESRDALRGLGQCLLYAGRYQEAYDLFNECTEELLTGGELWDIRARAALALEEPMAALQNLECAERLGFFTDDMRGMIGDLYLNEGMPDAALPHYSALLQRTNAPVDHVLQAVRVMIGLERFEEAGALMEGLEGMDLSAEQQARLRLAQAEQARRQGAAEEAEQNYRAYLGVFPLDASVLLELGDLLRESGRAEEALMQYERAGRADGTFAADAAVRCGVTEVERRRYRAALEWLEKAQTLENRGYVARYIDQLRRMMAP